MHFSELAIYLEKLEKTASRNEMTKILAEVLKKAKAEEIDKICYLLLGELLPAYRGVEFNIAEKMMIQIIAQAYARPAQEAARLYKSRGDMGDAVYELAVKSRSLTGKKRLMINDVYQKMTAIAEESGEGSQERKVKSFAGLLSLLDPLSAKFVARIPVAKLRLGFSEATLLDAFSVMEKGDKSARSGIERAYNLTADIGLIAQKIKVGGLGRLKKLEAQPGIPLRFSLAERLRRADEVIEKAGPDVGVERKLDGFRTQIHVWEEHGQTRVALFSRNHENTTLMFPEIVQAAEDIKVKSAILDGETIGYNPKTGKFLPFQETVQRKRKYGIEEFAKKIPLSIFVFDILYLNGKSLLDLPFRKRREVLVQTLTPVARGAIRLAEDRKTDDPAVIEEELKKSIEAGLEGLVVKNFEAPYEAGKRGFHWIKLKAAGAALEEIRAGAEKGKTQMLDTVDCVLMGAYRGRGKRATFGFGGFLLGIGGPGDRYYTITRLGTGLSDEQFREAQKRVNDLKVSELPKQYVVDKDMTPDIWLKPSLVVEILADEITLSPRHTAGRKEEGRGYSLRFPRLVRFRDDKKPEDATTISEIRKMYRGQRQIIIERI